MLSGEKWVANRKFISVAVYILSSFSGVTSNTKCKLRSGWIHPKKFGAGVRGL